MAGYAAGRVSVENDPTATSVVRRSSRGNADGRPYAAPVIAGANVSITDVLIHIITLSDLIDPLTCDSIGARNYCYDAVIAEMRPLD